MRRKCSDGGTEFDTGRQYQEDVLRRIMSHPAKKMDELLPDRWLASRQQIAAMQTGWGDGLG